jgi:manganese oxidase
MNAILRRSKLCMLLCMLAWLSACSNLPSNKTASATCAETPLFAEVIAFEQPIVVNRFGAFMAGGMLYALKRDVVRMDDNKPLMEIPQAQWPQLAGRVKLRDSKRPRPLVLRANEGQCIDVRLHNLMTPDVTASTESDVTKIPAFRRGRPLWDHNVDGPSHMVEADTNPFPLPDGTTGRELVKIPNDELEAPRTRAVSFHVTGLSHAPIPANECPIATRSHPWVCGSDAYIGNNTGIVNPGTEKKLAEILKQQGSLVYPGQSAVYRYIAEREGTFFAHSLGAPVGGEGDGGQLAQGLFAAVNVQSKGARWFRSQVTHEDLKLAQRTPLTESAHPGQNIDYMGARYPAQHPDKSLADRPVLAMLDKGEIVHSDLNAIIVLSETGQDGNDTTSATRPCAEYHVGASCGKSYREFTVIMHDEVDIVQAFAELKDHANPLHYIKDNMGINYGVGGMGAMVVARKRGVGPAKNCPECRAEEFFLSSWANGDPALVLKWDSKGKKPVGARFPDDPSNVHHSYLNDPVRFRNIHAGPKETHVFHLHAHQWVYDQSAPGSTYLDSQTISPGATFSYEIAFGGSGNRNLSPGDSIFHCHLYPHFAQGMWELWRTHDVFEQGSRPQIANALSRELRRKLPDAEVEDGTEVPAIVPIPGIALAPMPTQEFAGYPFYVAGEAGHRPPQPPMDFDKQENGNYVDGGLPRHVLRDRDPERGTTNTTEQAEEVKWQGGKLVRLVNQDVIDEALSKGGAAAQINAARVYARNDKALKMLAESWKELGAVKQLAYDGEPGERIAMDFHAGKLDAPGFTPISTAIAARENWNQTSTGYKTEYASVLPGGRTPVGSATFFVNGRDPKPGAPFADPCPLTYEESGTTSDALAKNAVARVPLRRYKTAFIQTELTVNRHGWFDPQARILSLEQDVKDIINPNTRIKHPEPLFFRANSGDCIEYKSSNFIPNALALDDFQIYTPTDTIGQHIHLVKFDVTSSDGSGNGWNYEDGTYSPEEVRERVFAYNRWASKQGKPLWILKTHPLFDIANVQESCQAQSGDISEQKRCQELIEKGVCPSTMEQNLWNWSDEVKMKKIVHDLNTKHPLCGAQRTTQRWWADPVLDTSRRAKDPLAKPELGVDKDYTLRTVFTHDHFGPSSHQQHGLYAALVVEPANSVWLDLQSDKVDWDRVCSADRLEREQARAAVLGGANLSVRFDEKCAIRNAQVGVKELRPALQLRNDGGPSSPRATIVAPSCVDHLGSNPLGQQQQSTCANDKKADQTRREFGVAFADFAIVYNTAMEPINPENRDLSALYLGRRQVPYATPAPLAISSEDPGTQLINYRHEPIPLRVAEPKATAVDKDGFAIGGFDFILNRNCLGASTQCTADMANVFSTPAHKERDLRLVGNPYTTTFSGFSTALLKGKREGIFKLQDVETTIEKTLGEIESWRKDFHCALYPATQLPSHIASYCNQRKIQNYEPWREMGDPATPILAAYEGDPVQIRLIQGAQEAQHVFAMNGGVRWLKQPNVPNSGYVAAQPLGISEHFEFDIRLSAQRGEWDRVDRMYYGSSMDQLWDGMWGVMRSFDTSKAPAPGTANKYGLRFNPITTSSMQNRDQPGSLEPGSPAALRAVCAPDKEGRSPRTVKMDVSAVTVRQLYESCQAADPGAQAKELGLVFNQRNQIHDTDAVVFLPTITAGTNGLRALQEKACQSLKTLEPLVFRAGAGDCILVSLMNHVPPQPRDGSESIGRHGYNLMSMLVDGVNFNQISMSGSVGLSAPLVAQDPIYADGSNVGINGVDKFDVGQGSLARPAARAPVPYAWYAGDYQLDVNGIRKDAPIELGAVPLRSFGDVIKHPAHSLVGALVIGPQGSMECTAEQEQILVQKGILLSAEVIADSRSGPTGGVSRSICNAAGDLLYRDFVLILQDAIDGKQRHKPVPNLEGAEEPDDYGVKGINFRSEPLWGRRGGSPSLDFNTRNESDYAQIFSSKRNVVGCQSGIAPLKDVGCDPETPIFIAKAGTEVRFRIVHPGGHTRQQAIAIAGHRWSNTPYTDGSTKMHAKSEDAFKNAWTVEGNAHAVGPMMSANLLTRAGGTFAQPGDYLIRSQSSFLLDGGVWGLFRVLDASQKTSSNSLSPQE